MTDATQSENPLTEPFFAMLTSSRYAQPLWMLGSSAITQAIADAVRLQRRVIRAVGPSAVYRVAANGTDAERGGADPPADATYAGTSTNPRGRRRWLQDPVCTCVLQALLVIVCIP